MAEGARLSYVYGVTRGGDAGEAAGLPGVAGTGVRHVAADGLAAMVSTVPEGEFDEAALYRRLDDLDALEGLARAHHEVIDAVAVRAAVLPLRLATIYRDDDGVRGMLREERGHLEEALGRVAGCAEWGVKVYADPDAGPSPGVRVAGPDSEAEATGGSSGRDYLRRRKQERRSKEEVWRNAAELAARADEELSALAVEVHVHRPQDRRLSGTSGENVLNTAYLVPADRTTAFTAIARGLAEGLPGARLELTGPWAPYSFTAAEPADDAGTAVGIGSGTAPEVER